MQRWLALLNLIAPLLSTLLLVRLVGPWPRRVTGFLAGSVVYITLVLTPIHLFEILRIFGVADSLSPQQGAFFQIILLALLGVLSAPWLWRFHSTVSGTTIHQSASQERVPKSNWICFAIVGLCWSAFAANALSSYPLGQDSLCYHLPVAVRWLQLHTLAMSPSHNWNYCLPGNAEVGMMLLLEIGSQTTVFLFNTLAAVIAMAATFALAHRFSADRQGATMATLVVATVPIVQFQAFDCYVDLFGAAFVLAGLALFLSRHEGPKLLTHGQWYPIAVVFAGCALGIALGTKPTYYVYVSVFLVGIALRLLSENQRRGQGRSTAAMLVLLIASVLLPSGFWFLRAFLETSNPLYPLRVEVWGQTLFKGVATSEITDPNYDLKFVRSQAEWLVYPWLEYKTAGYNYGLESGLGAAWATFIPLGCLYSCLRSLRGRLAWGTKDVYAVVAACVMLSVLWWLGLRRMPRFAIPLIAFTCVFAAPMFALLRRSESVIFRWLLVASVATSCAVSGFEPVHMLLGRIRLNRWDRAFVYGYPPEIDALPGGSRILVMQSDETFFDYFAVAGSRLTNQVILGEWLGGPLSERALKAAKIDYIFERSQSVIDPLVIPGVRIHSEGHPEPPQLAYHWRLYSVAYPSK